ncbi:GroES-like protein [Aureobasidium pullulans]|nr:GroES-like protein [Aureobasidium pullulans]
MGHIQSDRTKMRNPSFVLKKVNELVYENRPKPLIQHEHDVLLEVNYTGICGSEIHYWTRGQIGPFVVREPMVLGHESSGTVVKVGKGVTNLKIGDRVAMEPGIPCRRCSACKNGTYNLCKKMAFAATPPYDGTLAQFYILPEDLCCKLPDNVSLQEGAMLEPLSVAVHICRQGKIQHGDSVVVFGAGPIGLLCCAVARAYGAGKVIAVDIQKSRLDFARSFAASATFEYSGGTAVESAQKLVQENDLGDGADVAIDASGAASSIQTAINVLRMGGSYVQGKMPHADIPFSMVDACTKELTIRGSFRYGPKDYETALGMVATGAVDVKKLITKTVPFEDAEQAFHEVKEGKVIKLLIAGPSQDV